jgi:hypothetical protein
MVEGTVLRLDTHRGKKSTSFFAASPLYPDVICLGKVDAVIKAGDKFALLKDGEPDSAANGLPIANPFQRATDEQLKRFNSQKKRGVDDSLF